MPAATAQDAARIRNGNYVIKWGESSFSFKVHTITSARTDDLIGKRVISRVNPASTTRAWQPFAFLATDGTMMLWHRFDELAGTRQVQACKLLLIGLCRHDDQDWPEYSNSLQFTGPYMDDLQEVHDRRVTVEYKLTCRVCNGALEDADDRTGGVHYNGNCTTELSPSQLRNEALRVERERQEARDRARREEMITQAANARQSGGSFEDVPLAIVANLPRSPFNRDVIR